MIPVYQNRFGGSDSPVEEQGNCFQACVASILELALGDAFDPNSFTDEEWFDAFNSWLRQWNLSCWRVEATPEKPIGATPLKGVHMVEVQSTTSANPEDGHVVVINDGIVVHDPNPCSRGVGPQRLFWVFTTIDASLLVNGAPNDN